jgi:hypothetical protein
VFVFKLPEEYHEFFVNMTGATLKEAEETKGYALRDFYATYYEAPNDLVHAHEGTHQIFRNRLFLDGGGSWFQEGVAEYMCTKHSERSVFAKGAAKRAGYMPFREFVQAQKLIAGGQNADGKMTGPELYAQAASLIEFVRDGKWHADKFPDFVERIGLAPANDLETIEGILQELYGVDVLGLEKAWVRYWSRG